MDFEFEVQLGDGSTGRLLKIEIDRPGFCEVDCGDTGKKQLCVNQFEPTGELNLIEVVGHFGLVKHGPTLAKQITTLAQRKQVNAALWLYVTAKLLEKWDQSSEREARSALVAARVSDPDQEFNRLYKERKRKAPVSLPRGRITSSIPNIDSETAASMILSLLANGNLDEADRVFSAALPRISKGWYQPRRDRAEGRAIQPTKLTVVNRTTRNIPPNFNKDSELNTIFKNLNSIFELILFDLDDTLVRTLDLAQFRGVEHIGQQNQSYVSALTRMFKSNELRHIYSADEISSLRRTWPNIKIGIFTRAPRHYTNTVLRLAYPALSWDTLVTYEDVRLTKPSGEGVRKAMQHCGVSEPYRVAMIGDHKSDVQAAYNGGCWAILDQSSWSAPFERDNWWALERVPDAVIKSHDLTDVLANPIESLPELEREIFSKSDSIEQARRFDKINHFNPLTHGKTYPIYVLGRIFNHHPELQDRIAWHPLTRWIHQLKDAHEFPEPIVNAICTFLRKQVRVRYGVGAIVTVVPFKPGRTPRLERLLSQVEQKFQIEGVPGNGKLSFAADLLAFKDGVHSNNLDHLDKQARFENIRDHLYVKNPGLMRGMQVVVIDDVVTSGASLIYSREYLEQNGATQVTCLSITKAVGSS